jgi:outer membrane protein TolC
MRHPARHFPAARRGATVIPGVTVRLTAWRMAMARKIPLALVCVALFAAGPPPQALGEQAPQPLTLEEAVDIALRHNPAIAAAEGREDAAWAAVAGAGAQRWPQVRLDSRVGHVSEVAEVGLPGVPPVPLADEDTWVTAAMLQQLLFSGGRVSALVRQAEQGAEAARDARLRVRQLVAFGAERAFRLLLAAQEETDVAAKNLAAAESHLRVANERLAARAAARFDVLRAEVEAEEARQEVIRADGVLVAARAELLQALGLEVGAYRAVAPLPPAADAAPRPAPETLVVEALRLRPDLRGLALQVAAAESGVRAARAERAPVVTASADYLYADPESQTLFSRWSVGAALSLPVLDGGTAASHRAAAEAVLVQARATLAAQQRQVEAEVRQALARAATAEAQVVVAARRLAQAEELLRLAEVRFVGGVGTATEIADAQASLARARYVSLSAGARQGIAAAEVALAVGTTATVVTAATPAVKDGRGAGRGAEGGAGQ